MTQKRPSFAVRLRSFELKLQEHVENLQMQIEYAQKTLLPEAQRLNQDNPRRKK